MLQIPPAMGEAEANLAQPKAIPCSPRLNRPPHAAAAAGHRKRVGPLTAHPAPALLGCTGILQGGGGCWVL